MFIYELRKINNDAVNQPVSSYNLSTIIVNQNLFFANDLIMCSYPFLKC